MLRVNELNNAIILSEPEIRSVFLELGWKHVIDRVEETFIEEAKRQACSPAKTIIDIPEFENDFRVMPARMMKYPDFCGVKIISACTPCPKKFNLPLARGTYLLNDAETQNLLLIFDANLTTAIRTAAASAVAVRALSSPDSVYLGIIGCGQQAKFHVEAISAVRNIERVLLYDINEACTADLYHKLLPKIDVSCVDKEVLFRYCDIVVTLTPTREPHIFIEDIPERSMMMCAVGGDSEKKRELHYSLLDRTDNVCDSYDQVSHTGTIVDYKTKTGHDVELKSLGDILISRKYLDENKLIKLFLSTGVALQDLMMAIILWENIN